MGPASADSLFQLTVLFHNLLSLDGDQQKKEKERNRSSLYVRTRTLDHVLFFFWIAKRKKDDRMKLHSLFIFHQFSFHCSLVRERKEKKNEREVAWAVIISWSNLLSFSFGQTIFIWGWMAKRKREDQWIRK